jgi:hypothetical protein
MRRDNCNGIKNIRLWDRLSTNSNSKSLFKFYVSSDQYFCYGFDKDTVALAVTVDHSVTRENDSRENGLTGLSPQSSMSFTFFNDINVNRIQDAGEMGVAGLII